MGSMQSNNLQGSHHVLPAAAPSLFLCYLGVDDIGVEMYLRDSQLYIFPLLSKTMDVLVNQSFKSLHELFQSGSHLS